jgi:hypothetical protein
MPVVVHEVSTYSYELRSTAQGNVALLNLFTGNRLVCRAEFFDGSQALPPPRESPTGVVFVAFRSPWLMGAVDMLRNERPVYVTWVPENQVARITTEEEPAGEEERPKRRRRR